MITRGIMPESTSTAAPVAPSKKLIGFWGCWALAVGTMIGSGVFMLPAVLAPYGLLSFGGWLLTGVGSIAIALVLARLAGRTTRTGGMQVYAQDAFGDMTGFLVAWSYWIGCWISTAAMAIAFVGYFNVLVPGLSDQPAYQALVALGVIWTLTAVSIRGVKEAGFVQLAMTLLKLIPLLLIIGLATVAGNPEYVPPMNPSGGSPLVVLSVTVTLTMYALLGMECGVTPAGNIKDPTRTIPRAVVIGTITVAAIYIASTAAVMLLVPADVLATSTSPFADAARGLGDWGPLVITIGALVSVCGSLNGNIFITGQLPMAAALDGLAPKFLARLNKGDAPWVSLVLGSVLASVVLLANYSRGLVGAFTFLLTMTTLAILAPYLICALAELKHSWKSARRWAVVALFANLYSLFAIIGSGLEAMIWGGVLVIVGLPIHALMQRVRAKSAAAMA